MTFSGAARNKSDVWSDVCVPVSLEPPRPEEDPLLGNIGRRLGRGKYRIDRLVGVGGMGAVYRGHHRDLDREVAVKILHPRFRSPELSKHFHAEAQTMSKIDHPNVTRVLDFGEEDDGLLYLAMQFLDGVDLRTLLRRDGPLELERLVKLMVQVSAGLGHVHRHEIIHRDVKPRNIVIVAGLDEDHETPTEVVKVCDFGIALATGNIEVAAGTPAYMSPEQVDGRRLDARSDIYAMGVLMYQLATGQLPFAGGSAEEIRTRHLIEAPVPPSRHLASLDPLFEAIILKALSKDPAARQSSMRQMRAELRELLAPAMFPLETGSEPPSMPSLPRASSLPPPPSKPPQSLMPGLPAVPELVTGEPRVPANSVSARPSSDSEDRGWLEKRRESYDSFFTYVAPTDRKVDAAWLADLTANHDMASFVEAMTALDGPVRRLLQSGDAPALSTIIVTMRSIIKQDPIALRAKYAGRILRLLRDPPRLAPFVDAALGAVEEPTPALQRILLETQAASAEALCAGRPRHGSARARERFVRLMRAVGPAALPALTATLRACLSRGERAGALVEDLLAAMPPIADDDAGRVVAELLRGGPVPTTTSAALYVIATLWGEHARPLLLGALGHPYPGVAIAAIAGLRVLRAIDARVVTRLGAIVTGIVPAVDELRVAATNAVAEASPEARSEATILVWRAFESERATQRQGSPPMSVSSPTFTISLARALLTLGFPNAVSLIEDRAALSAEPLRERLAALVLHR